MIRGARGAALCVLLALALSPRTVAGLECPDGLVGAECQTCTADKACAALLNKQGVGAGVCAPGA